MSTEEEWTERQRKLMERFKRSRGYWSKELWEQVLKWDPDFFEHYLNLSSHPYTKGPLPKKVKELIFIAIDAATTHLYEPGLRQHIRNALKEGATKEEIMEVLELCTLLGVHSCTLGVPILSQELKKLHQMKKPIRKGS